MWCDMDHKQIIYLLCGYIKLHNLSPKPRNTNIPTRPRNSSSHRHLSLPGIPGSECVVRFINHSTNEAGKDECVNKQNKRIFLN